MRRSPGWAGVSVDALGVVGFLSFFAASRLDDAPYSPFGVMAFVWFLGFIAIKATLPWLLSRRSEKEVRRICHRTNSSESDKSGPQPKPNSKAHKGD